LSPLNTVDKHLENRTTKKRTKEVVRLKGRATEVRTKVLQGENRKLSRRGIGNVVSYVKRKSETK
jgi:hypothetical protein